MNYSAHVITLSDRTYRGERKDESGIVLKELLEGSDLFNSVGYTLLDDDREKLQWVLIRLSDEGVSLIITTGGTGLSGRDVTADATLDVIEKEVPGIAELIRYESFKITKYAALSRAQSGIRGLSLIINFPGSVKAVREAYEIISPILEHALKVINTEGPLNCAEEEKL